MGVTTPERLLTLTRADLEVLGLDVVEQVTFKRELVVVLRARRRILQRQAASAAGTARLANPALRRTCDLLGITCSCSAFLRLLTYSVAACAAAGSGDPADAALLALLDDPKPTRKELARAHAIR